MSLFFIFNNKNKTMKVVKQWNAISAELKATIPQFKSGEFKNFEMVNGRVNDDFDEKERAKNPVLYPRTQIPTKDRIYDPYINEGQGGYVDIIVAEGWANDEPSRSRFFLVGAGDYLFNGRFGLAGSSVSDQELFEYLWICNYREGNPNRDTTIPALFRYIDVKQQSAKVAATEDEIFEAMSKVRSLNETQAAKIAASLNWPAEKDFEVLLSSLKVYARTNPTHLLEIANSTSLDTKAIIKDALDKGVLSFDTTTGKLTNKKNLLTTFDVKDGFVLLDEVAAWLASAANGKDVLTSIENQMSKKVA